jgi:hypothetical protein
MSPEECAVIKHLLYHPKRNELVEYTSIKALPGYGYARGGKSTRDYFVAEYVLIHLGFEFIGEV